MLKSLESMIASTILAMVLFLIFTHPIKIPGMHEANYRLYVISALKNLTEGKLREYCLNKNVDKIENSLSPYIPPFLNFKVAIYNKTSNITQMPSINSENIITVSYLIAGDIGNYSALEIRTFIWGYD
ncbi:MAG: hypothetical protein QXX38_02070 [Candidatus Aenigmatarchaeota archaeon]